MPFPHNSQLIPDVELNGFCSQAFELERLHALLWKYRISQIKPIEVANSAQLLQQGTIRDVGVLLWQ